jgi:ADP-heptose:LPS heptosyltransferase
VPEIRAASTPPLRKLLVVEFWGLGDLSFLTPLLQAARGEYEITVVGKPHAEALLQPTFPDVRFISFDAPWSAYRGKYALWKWNWARLIRLIRELRRERFSAAVSVRNDPRDHVLMAMIGAKRRCGFPRRGSSVFLTDLVARSSPKQHKVQDWRDLGAALGLESVRTLDPWLDHAAYRTPIGDSTFSGIEKPVICLHPGARIPVRRWPEPYFRKVIAALRHTCDFHLLLIPDPDGYGAGLATLADTVLPPLQVREMVDILGRCDLLLCNDSGPGHLAASCLRPVIPIFGPTDPDWFRPWGERHHIIIRDICPRRPCFDYCAYPEPYCMTRLTPSDAVPEILESVRNWIRSGVLPRSMEKGPTAVITGGRTPEPCARPGPLSMVYSMADQNMATTKSIGIYNLSLHLFEHIARHPAASDLTFLTNETIAPRAPVPGHVQIREINDPIRTRRGRMSWDQWGVYSAAEESGREWLFLPKGFSSFVRKPNMRVAAFVHDIMGDYYRRHYPKFWSAVEVNYFARSLEATLQHAEIIFTNTEFTKQEVLGLAGRLNLPLPRIIVSGIGFDPGPAPAAPVQKQNSILLFASGMPHKRTDLALRYLAFWLNESRFEGVIHCVGSLPGGIDRPTGPHWAWEGRVPNTDLSRMLREARAVVFVSEHEGFGMPPVEAVVEGTCPVYSDLPPLREVMQNCGFAFSNTSKESFALAMNQAIETPAETLAQWAAQLKTRHDWNLVVERVVNEMLP